MIKTLSKAQKMEREKFRIPRSVQDAIPIRRIFADGIFQVGNQYSKTWSFTDINYAIAGKEDKTAMFLDYSELLNALDSGASAKITIYNRRINKAEFERSVLLPDKDDGLDEYRHEFNRMLTAQVTGTSNSIVRERYLTVSVVKRNMDEARSYFARVGTDLVTHLAQLSSVAQELTLNERLHIFRDFFKAGEQAAAEFNIHEHAKRGQHFKDWFCPDSIEFAADHFKLDARYGRVLYLQDYASYIKDSFVSELCDLDRDLMLSIDILPVPTDEAARQLQSTLLGVETNVANWQRRQNANNNFTATIPYDMELQRKETKEMLDDLISMLGGRVAEALALGDISTGASNDLQRATQICRDMVAKYGMSEVLGPAVFSDENDEVFLGKDFGHVNNYSEATSAKIDAEIERMMRHAYSQTEEILKTHYEKLELVAETLLQKEKITGEMFAQLMENGKLDEPEAQPTEEPEAPAAEIQTTADTAPVPAPEGGDTPAAEAANAPADPAPEAPKSDR